MRAIVFALLLATPALGQTPPAQIVKPFAVCDETQCTLSKADWEAFQEFHAEKFAAMQMANALLQQAQEQVEALRNMLARYAAGCNVRRV